MARGIALLYIAATGLVVWGLPLADFHAGLVSTPQSAPTLSSDESWGLTPGVPVSETDAIWGGDERLTSNSVSDYLYGYGRHTVAVDPAGRVHVIWQSAQSPGSYSPQIYYKRYYPGSGWTADTCISADIAGIGGSYYPALCVDSSGNVHAVWHVNRQTAPTGYYIAYKMCTPGSAGNGGWQLNSTRISEDTLLWNKLYPAVTASPNGRIHVVYYCYHSTLGYCIGYKEKISNTWQPRVWVDSQPAGNYRFWPKIAADGTNKLHVVWYGSAPGSSYYQIGYRCRSGSVWGAVQPNISRGSYNQCYPSIAVNPVTGRVQVVWQGYDAGNYWSRIIHKEKLGTGTGDTFPLIGDTVSEPGISYHQYCPCITVTPDGQTHVVWYGYSAASADYPQIRYNVRRADGVWLTPLNLTSIAGSYRYTPSVNNGGSSSAPNDIHLVWYDNRDGNYEICYKHGTPQPACDLALYRISLPASLHEVGEDISPSVWIQNLGSAAVSGFSVKLDIGSIYSSTVIVNQTLGPGDTVNITGFDIWEPGSAGFYPVRCSVRLSGDAVPENNRLALITAVANFIERFDTTNGGCSSTGGWQWGVPAGGARTPPPSTPDCWGDRLSGQYSPNANDTLVSFSLIATVDTPVILFQHWLNAEADYDGGNVKYSTDNGVTWRLIYPDGSRPYLSSVAGLREAGYSGSWGWERAQLRVPVSGGTGFRLQWRFASDTSIQYEGWLIDNVGGIGCRRPVDVGVAEILVPTGTIPWGVPVTPRAKVVNQGAGRRTFPVELKVGTVYADTQWVSNLGPGDTAVAEFRSWQPLAKGRFPVQAVTRLSGDELPGNDTAEAQVEVYLLDVQPTVIVKPAGEVDSGTVVAPEIRVRNNGSATVSLFYVRLLIGSFYDQQRLVVNLAPDEERAVTGFPEWLANQLGEFDVRCTTRLTGDMISENDRLVASVSVGKNDVGVIGITVPTGKVRRETEVTPAVRIANCGTRTARFCLHYQIYDAGMNSVYYQSDTVALNPDEKTEHTFSRSWIAEPVGTYQAVAWVSCEPDCNRGNDTARLQFTVVPPYAPGWVEMTNIPAEVKDGGFLVKNPDDRYIYAVRGYKSGDFYRFDPNADPSGAWTVLESWPLGREGRPPAKGSNGCYGGGYIWAMKGNNTRGFWRFDVINNLWEQLPDIPTGNSGRNSKGGGDLVYLVLNDTGYVYLLKGYKGDFLRYNTETQGWEILPDAPGNASPKWEKGSWLVYDGARTIYAHKAKYCELWAFDVITGAWAEVRLDGIPVSSMRTGKSRKPKDGSDGVYYQGFLYALKGGNTCEFWRYDIAGRSWVELETIPQLGSTGKRKRVNQGGSIVSNGDGAFFAFKGGKTRELWRYYDDNMLRGSETGRCGVQTQSPITTVPPVFRLMFNPVAARQALIVFNGGPVQTVRTRLYDAGGRMVMWSDLQIKGSGIIPLDLRRFSAGIYLLRIDSGNFRWSQKLVIY
ncbi:MAG: T9SS type A sorting domain-containing protein [candidate division WOR-3 bacterium]